MRRKVVRFAVLAWLLMAALLARGALAQGTGFDLSWWTVGGGGDTSSTGGAYTLHGTIGQPGVGASMAGSSYALDGGFWGRGAPALDRRLYLPLVIK